MYFHLVMLVRRGGGKSVKRYVGFGIRLALILSASSSSGKYFSGLHGLQLPCQ